MDLVKAQHLYLVNQYEAADEIVNDILKRDRENREAVVLKAWLNIAAWKLTAAEGIATYLTNPNPTDTEALLILGKIRILQKRYAEALILAEKIQDLDSNSAEAYLLESEVYFWNQNPAGAERPLKKTLELDPFNADARFSYGYAIWRRRDARQLRFMANQWNLALDLNPLHYKTHWHWGNGHTNLDYSDYFQPNDEEVRGRLRLADSLVSEGKLRDALALISQIEKEIDDSVLPAMLRGSAFYMSYGHDRDSHLDSAQAVFLSILNRKPHFGPAHNGVAAVIKRKRLTYLDGYPALENQIQGYSIGQQELFSAVFPTLEYYPGDRVQNMVWSSLHTAKAYLPFLGKQKKAFAVPPLHVDLATAMEDNSFREKTTFDNRQWMDIRGVGSGAAGIEYVERGAHLERNVLLHEFVHLFHLNVFTDEEKRQVRQLFYNAKARRLTLDYYSENNDHEYLAQTYTAYFSYRKVHPLNHKSMNTRPDLESKDPKLFSFIQDLVAKQNAFMSGDSAVFKSNWAQVYVNLSEEARSIESSYENTELAEAYLDTALSWDPDYLPAHLSYADLEMNCGHMFKAKAWLNSAQKIDPYYAPLYNTYGQFAEALYEQGFISEETAIEKQVQFYSDAYNRENDLLISAEINRDFREFYGKHCLWIEALEVAEKYVENAPTVSSYLVDHRDDAMAFASWIRGSLGYYGPSGKVFTDLIARKPQNIEFQKLYCEILAINGRHKKAIQILEGAQRLLSSAGDLNADLMARIAEIYLIFGDSESARQAMKPMLDRDLDYRGDDFRLIRVLTGIGESELAAKKLEDLQYDKSTFNLAEYNYTMGTYSAYRNDVTQANKFFRKTLELNPYHHNSRMALIKNMAKTSEKNEAIGLLQEAMQLDLPWTPEFAARAYDYINEP